MFKICCYCGLPIIQCCQTSIATPLPNRLYFHYPQCYNKYFDNKK